MTTRTKMGQDLLDAGERAKADLRAVAKSISLVPGAKVQMRDDDLEQMVAGFFAVLEEAIDGREPVVRGQFAEAIFTSIMSAGEDGHRLLRLTTQFHVAAACFLTQGLPADTQKPATLWFSAFVGDYTADIAKLIAEAKP